MLLERLDKYVIMMTNERLGSDVGSGESAYTGSTLSSTTTVDTMHQQGKLSGVVVSTSDLDKRPRRSLVTWEEPFDPDNPRNWSKRRKLCMIAALSYLNFSLTFSSSIFSVATKPMAIHFHASTEVLTLTVSLFVLGFALGPLLWEPLSEYYGRKKPFFTGGFFFLVFHIPVALARNLPTVLICRFLSGAFGNALLAIPPGMAVDVFPEAERGPAIALYLAAIFTGPIIGPVAGSYLLVSQGWRWLVWIALILGAVGFSIGFVVMPETLDMEILRRRAAKLRRETRDPTWHTKWDENPKTFADFRTRYLVRPMHMTVQEPILIIMTIYIALVYGLIYLTFFAYPYAFGSIRHWRPTHSTLPLLAIVIGILLAILGLGLGLFNKRWWARRLAARGTLRPEDRIPPMILGSLLLPAGLFWFGWTAQPPVLWPAQVVSSIFIGAGIMLIYTSGIAYLIDVYHAYANSAIAANSFWRALIAAAFPLFSTHMYERLGVAWATSLVGFLCLAMVPFPVVLWVYGGRIRRTSRFTGAGSAEDIGKGDI